MRKPKLNRHYLSFTAILCALQSKTLTFEELESPKAKLCFGCAREHVLGDYVPVEVSWLKGNKSEYRGESCCDKSKLTPASIALWERFQQLIKTAEEQDRVIFRIGNYHEYCKKRFTCKSSVKVWYQQWRKPADYK